MLKDREGNPQCAYKDIANERITEASDGECYFEEDFTISSLRGKRLSITYRHFDPFSIYAYGPHRFGLYNMNGNVAEMVADRDIVVGGSWKNTGYDVRNESCLLYTSPSPRDRQ